MNELEKDLLKKFAEADRDTQNKLATASDYRERLLSILKCNLKVPAGSKVNQGELYIDSCDFSADLKEKLSDFIKDYSAFCDSNCQMNFRDSKDNPIITANSIEEGLNCDLREFNVTVSSQKFTYRIRGVLIEGIPKETQFGIYVTLNKQETKEVN